ncbi:Glutathione S-transferase-like protein OpS6 [Penicillium atrosanguineum]|uniref:Glutathione S-transferase-like protein OpS6 n=1 Tax=Penicillium atrosanguineum TaxID=1132637 RepID=UPI0023A77293|nr:Glutathione S-transferase-like protein OpS6 [Penicillium atrosanguineum]KAJ5304453.1 Glutathione S-transferase-like protein OpS6 [Penicillium atrosanguineum]
MASAPISGSLYPRGREQWLQVLRATLRECTYLPDPVARAYTSGYVLNRYRQAKKQSKKSHITEADRARKARKGLSLLQRANEGYQRPLEKVLHSAYGRIGGQRHTFLNRLLDHDIPTDGKSLEKLVHGPSLYQDGWEPPAIILSLMKSQMNNGHLSSKSVRPSVKSLQPNIPEYNSWGKAVSPARCINMRRKWYADTLNCLLPPLPDHELTILDDLISGTLPWAPIKRRKKAFPPATKEGDLVEFLTDGPQKGWTFAKYADGRPHKITARFMHRQWRRVSALVPRMQWNPISSRWNFVWDSPKILPRLSFNLAEGAELNDIFDFEKQTPAKHSPKAETRPEFSDKPRT